MTKKGRMAIITNFSTYEPRAENVGEFFSAKGYSVTYIYSDFLHREKKKRKDFQHSGHVYLPTKSYSKNISFRRIVSHYKFSRDLEKILLKKEFDVIYMLIPANFLLLAGKRVKKAKGTKLIVDVIDLWPESIVPKKLKNFPLIKQWRQIREKGLACADWTFTECDLYNQTIKFNNSNHSTMYWGKGPRAQNFQRDVSKKFIDIAYLGSINNIIDIDFICKILVALNVFKPVRLNIIGSGEKKEKFIAEVRKFGIIVKYHGPIYDDEKKKDILKTCMFGLNIMKDNVNVGLTMKSVEYFYFGIPIINNIKGDTEHFIDKYGVGVNINKYNYQRKINDRSLEKIIDAKRIQEFYNMYFTDEAFNKCLENMFSKIF